MDKKQLYKVLDIMSTKNYKQWNTPHYLWDDMEHFISHWRQQEGIHTVKFGPNNYAIDFYVNEWCSQQKYTVQPIFFSAAVTKRSEKNGPFFNGIGLARRANLPLIAFSDPAIDANTDLNLAWYAGATGSGLTENLNSLITFICHQSDAEPLFIGGSGGGFAALSVARKYEKGSTVLAWNPQTDIYKYTKKSVQNYLRICFNFANSSLNRDDWISYARVRTEKESRSTINGIKTIQSIRRLIYLQNSEDWHKDKHLLPFWKSISDSPLNEGKNYYTENHLFFVSNFANGHTPPPEKLIRDLITQLMDHSLKVSSMDL